MTSLSVGICAYNEAWNMRRLLSNLTLEQGIPIDSEVIIVCSGCHDSTPDIVREFSARDSRVKLIEEPNRLGKASAVNLILSRARGEFIVFVSADVIPQPGCIIALLKPMTNRSVGISCGQPVPVARGRPLIRGIVDTLWGFHNWQLEKLNDAGLLMHASEVFCLRNGIVTSVPSDLVNDDAYIAVRAKSLGYAIKYAPQSQVGVSGPQTVGDYIRQRRRIIAGHYQVHDQTGHFSQFLFYSVVVRPVVTFRILVAYFALHGSIRSGIATALLELAANLLAGVDRVRGKSHAIWTISTSTKTAREL
ncbi:MAG TPA: glycosyltransferase [Methylomirabilota bacterium]|nr:glycosyltransferase [Methylomirabilota bacterium]